MYKNGEQLKLCDTLEKYSTLMLTDEFNKKLFDSETFSSVGFVYDPSKNFVQQKIKKYTSFEDFDKNYTVESLKNTNTYVLFNSRKNLLEEKYPEECDSKAVYQKENTLAEEYVSSLNFKGKTLKSYETGIICLTVFSDDEEEENSFISGNPENPEVITNAFFSSYKSN